MNAKAKGTRAEHKSKKLLEAEGYRVTRAGASLGEWDLIGISDYAVILCQVKCSRWPGSEEMKRLIEFPIPEFCVKKVIHRWRPYKRAPDVRSILPYGSVFTVDAT